MLNGRIDRKSCYPSFICRGSPDEEEDGDDANENNQADEESAMAISNDRDRDQLQKNQRERAIFVEEALTTTTFALILQKFVSKNNDKSSKVNLDSLVTTFRTEASLSTSSSLALEKIQTREALLRNDFDDTNINTNTFIHGNDSINTHDEIPPSIVIDSMMINDDIATTTMINNEKSNEQNNANIPFTSCAICLEPYQPNDRLSHSKYRECTHIFHTDCIVSWLVDQMRDDCPYCRGMYIRQFGGDDGGDDCRNVVRRGSIGGNYVENGFRGGAREDVGLSQNTGLEEEAINNDHSPIDVR
ncbi:hypothetical protein ACHAXS_007283 [Conticribra weissflogii]